MDDLERRAVLLSTLHHLRQAIGADPQEFASMLMDVAIMIAPEMFDLGEDDEDGDADGREVMQ